ncbi:hypothetical protein COCSUDRAFT_43382 [Coccomyxa subellipsoidea C-169]|uniref:Uncharacterized protein n=1 Tax=Coccomyxa subellipsoidea (strain C-169) TaxID=574566 RepID=I0YRJ7_COCSC|nr:hypothetical protein COCSUDRAFT_43382 [Coccomyxa subellipsoidea C-169]EIE21016.1 hypothetical protein COCSUDRAFT_43382 [Coccomyxa subellipsoidea C-169]|eukprot:XP_005645560.1 hypothetical protein COCSUDRAFT_43382 [Coccomyxa subellipsoidea C-169]
MAHRHHKTPKREARIVCAAKKKKQQFGRSANAATPGILDEELEAAYRQFGKALGETPRETSQVVHENLNIPAASAQGRSGTSANPNERRMSEESYAQFEAMLDRAMKGSGDSQPKSLLKGKNTVALQAGERERRKVIMELMESTLYSETESFSVDLGLDVIQPASRKPQEEVPELILPRGKAATSAKRPAARAAAGKLEGTPALAGPLPVPALQMPKGKLPRREPPATATVAPPAALQPPLPVPAFAPKPSLAAPKVRCFTASCDLMGMPGRHLRTATSS